MSLVDPAAVPFSAALLLVLMLVVAEIVGALVGVLPSAMMDSALPDVPDADADIDADVGVHADVSDGVQAPGGVARFLAWFSIGKVPALIILIVFLAAFGLIGLVLLGIAKSLTGLSLPAVLTVPVAVGAALYPTRWAGAGLTRVFRGADVAVVSADDFVGRIAVITGGTATVGLPAEGKLTDTTGQTHYVRIEPEEDERFVPGTSVLITKRVSSVYKAILNPSDHLKS